MLPARTRVSRHEKDAWLVCPMFYPKHYCGQMPAQFMQSLDPNTESRNLFI